MLLAKETPLAHKMGTTAHLSPLLQKAQRLGVRDPRDLESIALKRGLRYFGLPGNQEDEASKKPTMGAEDASLFTNEELAIALINPAAPYSLNRIRMAGALMAEEGISAVQIVRLARLERCEITVRHIAKCGATVEPMNPFWQSLLKHLPTETPANPDVLPHISRFVAMSGITRNGRQSTMQWIRPTA